MPRNKILIFSINFSHYLPSNASNFHDDTTFNVIINFDFDSIYRLDTDSRPGLATTLAYAQALDAKKFNLFNHANAQKISGKEFMSGASYITGAFASKLIIPIENERTSAITLHFCRRYCAQPRN